MACAGQPFTKYLSITMCGRFALAVNARNAVDATADWIDEPVFVPRFNIAPRTYAPVIRNVAGNRVLHSMKWGLVPHWSTVEDKSLSTTNARSENLVQGGGMWASIKGKNRCAVVCQGYYEWLDKRPHFVKRKDGQLMLMAGLYDHATIAGVSLWTFAIVTTDACPDFSWLHDRQPVILSTQDALQAWLDPSTQSWTPALTKLVQPYGDQERHPLEWYVAVSIYIRWTHCRQLSGPKGSRQSGDGISIFY